MIIGKSKGAALYRKRKYGNVAAECPDMCGKLGGPGISLRSQVLPSLFWELILQN